MTRRRTSAGRPPTQRGTAAAGRRTPCPRAPRTPPRRSPRPAGRPTWRSAGLRLAAEDILAAEGPAEHLPGRVAGQLVDDLDLAGDLEPRQVPGDAVGERLGRHGGPRFQYDDRLHRLTRARVGDADDDGVGDSREADQCV